MFPASFSADCSSLPRLGDVPRLRRSIRSASLSPAGMASRKTVCPVMSPNIDICTATISSLAAISGTKSPGGTMFTIGTLIMIRVPVSVDSAVAAWPAPMFATSLSASSRAVLRWLLLSPAGVLLGFVISEKTRGVHDERGRPIAKNGRAAEKSFAAADAVELFDDDFLLPDEFVHDERRPSLGQLDEHYLSARRARCRRKSDPLAQPDSREKVVADRYNLPAFRFEQHRLRETECLKHVGERYRVRLLFHSGQQRARDCQGQRQAHADAGAKSGVGVHFQ